MKLWALRRGAIVAAIVLALAGTWADERAEAQAKSQGKAQATAQPAAQPAAPGWPRQREANGHSLLMWKPQVDSWENHARIAFRAAIAVRPAGKKDYVYGVVEVQADTQTDVGKRTVLATNVKRDVRFPNAPPDEAARLAGLVGEIMPIRESVEVPLDVVLAYVRSAPDQQRAVELNLDPPTIFYSAKPAVLVMFMGDPQLRPLEGTQLMFAINTNWDVLYDVTTAHYFLLDQDSWLTTPDPVKGPWVPARSLPKSFSALPNDPNWAEVKKRIPGKPATRAPVVFVSKEPAEMILVDGEPAYSPVPGTKLLYVSNTSSVLFLHSGEGQYYYLVAGRWFRARKLSGPWSAATKDLPPDFLRIPDDHPLAGVRTAVPGTEEAKDAILLASVPRTTEVKVGQPAPASVAYEGAPKFEPISNIGVSYAVNTPSDVFVVDGQFYWVYQAVWYCGASPQGPWTVCTSVAPQIYQIPVSSPKYNVTYVYVYPSPPQTQTVTVGYTAGYSGEYVAATGVLMFGVGMLAGAAIADSHYHYYSYGTGAYYHYGQGGYYASAQAYGPYGSAGAWASYNPATGTYARGGYASGPSGSARWGSAYNPYTGGRAAGGQVTTPYGSRGGYAAYNPYTGAYSRGGYVSGQQGSAYAQSGYNPTTGTSGARAGVSTEQGSAGRGYVQQGDEWARGGYRSTSQGTAAGVQTSQGGAAAGVKTDQGGAFVGQTASGDVYAGHDGNVYKKGDDGSWQKNSGDGWSTVEPPPNPRTSATSQSSTQSQRRAPGSQTSTQPQTLATQSQRRGAAQAQSAQAPGGSQARAAVSGGGSQLSGDMRSQLEGDASARQRSEAMGGTGSFQGKTQRAAGGSSSGGGRSRGGARR